MVFDLLTFNLQGHIRTEEALNAMNISHRPFAEQEKRENKNMSS